MTKTLALAASVVALLVGVASPAHAQSAVDGFNPGANGFVLALSVQPDGKILVGGSFTTLGGGGTGMTSRNFIGRLNPDGSLDTTFDPGANDSVRAMAVQPDGKILVGGSFTTLGGGGTGTTPRHHLGRLNADGSLDQTFNPGAPPGVVGQTRGRVTTLAVQPDGKILVSGESGWGRLGIERLNPDGSLDTTFNPPTFNPFDPTFNHLVSGDVHAMAVQSDGKIVVSGTLRWSNVFIPTDHILLRLHPNGSFDRTFASQSAVVRAVAVQPDGKILVGGQFDFLRGGPRSKIGRLHPDGSLDTTFDPGANGNSYEGVYTLAVQPDGKILVGGRFTMLGGGGTGTTARSHIGRLLSDGSLDVEFDPGANDPGLVGAIWALVVQPDGKILVGGGFTTLGGGGTGTTPRSRIGRLHADGTVDADFDPGANSHVITVTVQPDGKILVGGGFTTLGGGGTGTTARSYLGRLQPDGSLDSSFNPGANSNVLTLALQPDGKVLAGGVFTTLGGGGTGTTPRNFIGRLHPDGSLDAAFNPGTNGQVNVIAVEPDGQILVGGDFTSLGGTSRSNIGRLNADGSVDTTFNPGASGGILDGSVWTLAVQPNGQILVGGDFTSLGGSPRSNIGRLHPDGTLDAAFNPGANSFVQTFGLQPDGKIVVGGGFTTLGGGGAGMMSLNRIGRLNADGSLDTSFDPGANGSVYAVAVQTDGQILLGGDFTTLGGGGSGTSTRNRIGRLNPDGSLDSTFNPGANGSVMTLAVQPDGKILAGGPFTALGGGGTGATPRNWIGRLTNTGAAFQRLNASCPGCGSTPSAAVQAQVTWARSAAGPEVERVTFEASTDGVTYAAVTTGTRVVGGWQATLNASSNSNWLIRARGYYATGFNNKSGSIVESIRQVYLACPSVAPSSLPAGATGYPYAASFTAPDAIGVVTFGVTGTLPAGLTLSSTGTLSGTPTQAGTFPLTVTATDLSSGCAGWQVVTLLISPTPPTMTLDKTSLRFAAVTTGAAFVSQTATQVVRLTQSGAGTVTWTAVPSQSWLQVSPASGSGSADISISVVAVAGLPVGSPVAAAITLTVTGASNAPGPITVVLDLLLNERSVAPIGVVDTPLDQTTGVTGAIPFTGWALDDVEVTRVMVCRAAVTGEIAPVDPNCAGAAQIFVGLAVFIDGARPDVAAFYPTYPLHTRGGWGFMVLTNMLPDIPMGLPAGGNGTFQFSMYAQDRDGHTTVLGARTLTCANASATKPFGAIDTPTQGGVASGSSFVNFGWALTPQPKLIPLDGSTMSVLVDGTAIGTVDYNHERADIETLFPGYQNTVGSNGAVGFRVIDTTTLTNGLHTISWTVVDDQGGIEGIGSRYFTVSNGAGAVTAVEGAASSAARPPDAAAVRAIDGVPQDTAALVGRRGWDPSAPRQPFAAGSSGRIVIRSEEVSRVELTLAEAAGARYTGYLRTSDGLAPLPIGSHLDATTGVFTWAPGVGFVGAYDLVFVRWAGAQALARHEVRVILAPKGSGAVGAQVVIDVPRSQQAVGQPFVLGGWAADLNATAGTGIATVHVWAYALAGGPPVFLGATAYGGARPDVAAVHGDAFRDSGFGLVVQGLAPGDYDLAVFAWSTEAAEFAPAKVVRVTVR
jgi:uncharacterized delta-60 repeat protein